MSLGQPAKLVRIHLSEADRYKDKPLYAAIVEKCRDKGIAGATVFRGIEGYGESAEIHRHHLVGSDQPVVIQIVDSMENLQPVLADIEAMIPKGLIAISDVEVIRVQKTK